MANISQSIRSKRFYVKDGMEVWVDMATQSGQTVTLRLENCALGGVGVVLDSELPKIPGVAVGEIQPAAKLRWNDQEFSLGRVVIRSIRPRPGATFFGLSLVDVKFPIDGDISKALVSDSDRGVNPFEYELSPSRFNLASFQKQDQKNVDVFSKCRQFSVLHAEWQKSPKFQYRTVREPSLGTRVKLQRKRRGGRNDYLVMGSNDYWGLASHPRVIEAAQEALEEYGFGSTGSPVTTGTTEIHIELEEYLAKMYRKEKAILFNSGFTANVGAITALLSEQDIVIADILCHASIQNAMQMSSATSRYFKHNDMKHLEKQLAEHRNRFGGALIITEGIFSMDGDYPPLDKILELSQKYNARVYVDEAHSLGILGPKGLGVCDKFDAIDRTDVIMGTFSKLCGGIGGFVVGDADVIDWLYFYASSHLFSVSMPPSNAAAALAALKIFTRSKGDLEKLRENIRHFITGLRELGCPLNANHESTVVPVVIGDEEKLGIIHQHLMDQGVFSIPMVYPAVSRNGSRFRFTIMKDHTVSDLDYVLNVLESGMAKAEFSFEAKELAKQEKAIAKEKQANSKKAA